MPDDDNKDAAAIVEEPVETKFRCRCGALLTAPESSANETVACQKCGRVLVVPKVPVAAGMDAEGSPVLEEEDEPVAEVMQSPRAARAGKTSVSGMAVASLVLGIVGPFLSVLSIAAGILAVVFGSIALKAIKRSPWLAGRGMAIAGTILGVINLLLGLTLIISALQGARPEDRLDVICFRMHNDKPPTQGQADDAGVETYGFGGGAAGIPDRPALWRVNMKILMLSANGFEDLELIYPWYRLRELGAEVVIASPQRGTITGLHGYTVKATAGTTGHNPKSYDALVLPGGKAPEEVRQDVNAVKTAAKFMKSDKPVAVICHGVQILISAQAVKGRRLTCWPALRDDARAAGAGWEDKEVVVDGNLISSRKPDDLPAFCRELVAKLRAVEAEAKKAA